MAVFKLIAAPAVVVVKSIRALVADAEGVAVIERLDELRRRSHLEIIKPEYAAASTRSHRTIGEVLVDSIRKGGQWHGGDLHSIHIQTQEAVDLVEMNRKRMPVVVINTDSHKVAAGVGDTCFGHSVIKPDPRVIRHGIAPQENGQAIGSRDAASRRGKA